MSEAEESTARPAAAELDKFLIDLLPDCRVTGWVAVVEVFNSEGVPGLWHYSMPGITPWHAEGLLRASIDVQKMPDEEEDGEDF